MNSRPWPQTHPITPVDTSANTEAELRQVFATLNNLIRQFNELTSLHGGLQQQIFSIIEQLNGLYPFDGLHDAGYISNEILKNWPATHFEIGSTINNVLTTILDITLDGTPSSVLTAAAGVLEVRAGGAYLDASHNYGIDVSGSDLRVKTGSGKVIPTGGYKSTDGTPGASASTGGATFKDGLYTGGTISGSGDPGTVEDVAVASPANYYCRYNAVGPGTDNGAWQNLSTFFPGLPSPADAWGGSTALDTLGTVTTGTWNADPITLDNFQDIAANSILGNNTGVAAAGIELTVPQVLTMLGYGSVKGEVTTTGAASFGSVQALGANVKLLDINNGYQSIFSIDTSLASPSTPFSGNIVTPNRMRCPGFKALADSATGFTLMSAGGVNMFIVNTLNGDVTMTAKVTANVFQSNVVCSQYDYSGSWALKNAAQTATLMYADTRSDQLRMYIYNLSVVNGMATPAITATNATATNATVTNLTVPNVLIIPQVP